MRLLASATGFVIATVGAVGVVDPSLLLELGRSLQAPSTRYVVAVILVVCGIALLWIASTSRLPQTNRVIGFLFIVVAVLGALHGGERSDAVLLSWEARGPLFMRASAAVAIAAGLFLTYAVKTPRQPAASRRIR